MALDRSVSRVLHLVAGGALAALLASAGTACGSDSKSTSRVPALFDPDTPYEPDFDASTLSPDVTHALYPLPVGATWVYENQTDEGLERIEIEVLDTARVVAGATVREVRDTASLEGEVIEDTFDWFAEDEAGNVWYMGEDTTEFEGGEPVSTEGSWETGVDDALPGVVMLADPKVGDSYRQEYLVDEAEDYADIVSLDESVTVPAGSFTGCLKTRDRSVIEPDADEFKYYCPGIGNVLIESGDSREELVDYAGL